MTTDQHEIEDKYDVDADAVLPDLEQLAGVATTDDAGVHELEATYFDTDALALAAAGITVRRRTGGEDAGWHLKLPTKQGRLEVHESLARASRTVPKSLRSLVVAHTRGVDLGPVAVVHTRRHVHRLLDAHDHVLAELCDDEVTARSPVDGEPTTWREWELELVEGDTDLLAAAAHLVAEAGGRPARGTKLGHALGDRMPVRPAVVLPDPTRSGPASQVVQLRLREQVDALRRYDPLARHDAPDGVHQMRVAVRRLRNALASYRPLMVREQTEPLREELKWLAAALGEARDAEVMHDRLEAKLAEEPPEVIRGAGYERMDEEMRAAYTEARARMLAALESERYFALLDRLDALASDPPWRESAGKPVHHVLRKRLRHDYDRLAGRVELADAARDGERELQLHSARKAAKRVRYAAEALTGVYGKPARRLVAAMKRVQDHLGDHHDAHVTQARVRELGDEATRSGDNAFLFGVLHAREEQALRDTDEAFARAWRRASRKKLRRWLEP